MPYLKLNQLRPTPSSARLLPLAIAKRYHAIPVTVESTKITVAMANPEDLDAQAVISECLGAKPYFVQANQQSIDNWLEKTWSGSANDFGRVLVWTPGQEHCENFISFCNQVATLLDAKLVNYSKNTYNHKTIDDYVTQSDQEPCKLLILCLPKQSLINKFLRNPPECQLIDRSKNSVLVARSPRWPIRKILLVLRHDGSDQPGIDCCLDIAKRTEAEVTILPLILPSRDLYQQAGPACHHLSDLLSTSHNLGSKLRSALQIFVHEGIPSTLRLREEPPFYQIRSEAEDSDYDLIIVGAQMRNRVQLLTRHGIIPNILVWVDRPTLIARFRE
ncbi:MAG: hypothetical protein ABFS03_05420 [Chloroflexota bacterium]